MDRILADLTAAADSPHRTRHITVGRGTAEALARWAEAEHPAARHLVVCDEHTLEAAAGAVHAALEAAGARAELLVLEPRPGEDHVVCDDALVDRLRATLAERPDANPIAVGAGTVNDVVKMASHQVDRPYQVAPTAASMNGYTSAIAAILSRGVKRTLPCHQPEAIFADVDVLCAAPAFLTRAGFGDLLSKPYSNADWLLSHLVRDEPWDAAPAGLLDAPFAALLERAGDIGAAGEIGITLLTKTLLVSGFSMAMAGTSAPASGGEHLVSHYWDMEQHCHDAPLFGLHGTQVGVATRLSAMLYDRLVDLDAQAIDPAAARARRPDGGWLDRLAARHPRLTPPVLAEVREQIAAKQKDGDALEAEIARVRAAWPVIRERLREALLPAERITRALVEAGCAARPSELGVDRDHAIHTLRVCRDIRGRYCALDLLDDLGELEGWAAAVIDAAEEG